MLPSVTTSTPNFAVPESNISDVSDIDEDDNVADITQLSIYQETTSASEPESDVPVEKQQTYLIFESSLLILFSICFMCRSTYTSIEKVTIGSFLRIKQICHNCSNKYVWESQPFEGEIPAGNIMISAAILYTGSLPAKALRVFRSINCATITRKMFFRHQKAFLHPAISSIWETEQETLINQLNDKKEALILGGDGRADSPGHSAKYGSYSVIDLKQSKVFDIKLVQVLLVFLFSMHACKSNICQQSNEVKGSYHMEKEGLSRCINFLKDSKLEVDVLVTDRHKQINKWLQDAHPKITHYYDIWHVAKGMYVYIQMHISRNFITSYTKVFVRSWKR